MFIDWLKEVTDSYFSFNYNLINISSTIKQKIGEQKYITVHTKSRQYLSTIKDLFNI
jgi:hypothetical protein